jgi:hypothetical protein
MLVESTALSNFALVVLITLTMFHTRRYMNEVAKGKLKRSADRAFTFNRDAALLLSVCAPPPECTLSIRKIEYICPDQCMERIISVDCHGYQQLHELKKTIEKKIGRTIEYFELDGNRLPETLDCQCVEGVVLDPNFHGCPMGDKWNRSRWCVRTLPQVDPIWWANSHPARKSCLKRPGRFA